MEEKSKTDLVFHCLVCHGTRAAPNPTPAILCDFSPLPSSQMRAFCFAQRSVQGQAVGFLHSGVLITGSRVSCSHLSPPLHFLTFSFFSPIDILSLSPL